jgi:predicted GNAT family acetyltransferase
MEIRERPARAAGLRFSVDQDGREVARAYLYLAENDLHPGRPFGLLEDVFVHESARGQGLGAAIVRHAMDEARRRGCYKLIATTRHERPRVHAFYGQQLAAPVFESELAVRRGGQRQRVEEDHRWIWVTDLPADVVPATTIQRWGHARWDLETRGFGELTRHWHLDHCFIHHVVAMEALLLTLALAFLTTYLFYTRQQPSATTCSSLGVP